MCVDRPSELLKYKRSVSRGGAQSVFSGSRCSSLDGAFIGLFYVQLSTVLVDTKSIVLELLKEKDHLCL